MRMNSLKVVFMGTPVFAVNILEGLIENYNVVGVVSQPDRKVGRKQVPSIYQRECEEYRVVTNNKRAFS